MTRDDWNVFLESAPATANQVGAIQHEAARLGLDGRADRLAVCARLLDLCELGSTRDLTQGQAGKLVGILRRTRDRAELPEITAAAVDAEQVDGEQDDPGPDDGEHQDDGTPMTLGEAILRAAAIIYAISQGNTSTTSWLNIQQPTLAQLHARDRLPAHTHFHGMEIKRQARPAK